MRLVSGLVAAAQVDAQRQDAVLDAGSRVTDDGEVHEVGLGLIEEPLSLLATDWWHVSRSDRFGPFLEPRQHCIEVKLEVAHRLTLFRQPRRCRP